LPGCLTSHRLQPCHDKLQFGVLSAAMPLRPGSAAAKDSPPPHHPMLIHLHHRFCHHLPFTLCTSPYPYRLVGAADATVPSRSRTPRVARGQLSSPPPRLQRALRQSPG
jgi:hypothetical protein